MRDARHPASSNFSMTQRHAKINPEKPQSPKLAANRRKLVGFVCGKVIKARNNCGGDGYVEDWWRDAYLYVRSGQAIRD